MGQKLKAQPSANWLALQKVGELLSLLRREQFSKGLTGNKSKTLSPTEEEKTWP